MDIVIDTCSIVHFIANNTDKKQLDRLNQLAEERLVRIVFDPGMSLLDEWKRTYSVELIQVLVNKWEASKAITCVSTLENVHPHILKALRQRGFKDKPGDKLVLKISRSTTDRLLLTIDSDFHDPAKPSQHNGGPVSDIIRNQLSVQVLNFEEMVSRAT